MHPGPPRGASISIDVAVADDLAASVAPGVPATMTVPALVAGVEAACRELFGSHLDGDEVATVASVEIALRAPVPVGATIEVTATVANLTSTGLICEVLARHNGAIVARGSLEHRVLEQAAVVAEVAQDRADD